MDFSPTITPSNRFFIFLCICDLQNFNLTYRFTTHCIRANAKCSNRNDESNRQRADVNGDDECVMQGAVPAQRGVDRGGDGPAQHHGAARGHADGVRGRGPAAPPLPLRGRPARRRPALHQGIRGTCLLPYFTLHPSTHTQLDNKRH